MQKEWTTDHREWYRGVYLKSDHWKELKALKLTHNPICQRCGFKHHLDVHHVNYRNIFDVSLSDLLTLCRICHNKEHEANGMPVRKKISYKAYFPESAVEKINAQREIKRLAENEYKRKWTKEDWKQFHKRRNAKWKKVSKDKWESTRIR